MERIDIMERRLDLVVRALMGEFKGRGEEGLAEFKRLWAEAADEPFQPPLSVTVTGGLRESGPPDLDGNGASD